MPDADQYRRHKDRAAGRQREQSATGREVGPLPAVADPARRERCRLSLLDFCRTYFPARFRLPFAACHFETIGELEECFADGGSLAVAMPRGSGKTAIAECAVLHAVLYGVQRFAVLAQATQTLAAKSLKKIKRELELNPLLLADFPEVCYPIARLERISQRAVGQTLDGRPTLMEWTAEAITLPSVEGSAASGATLMVTGIESASRGLSVSGPNGEIIRPGLIVVDDAQTRDSAKSPPQTDYREAIVTDDMAGMVGPGETMALVFLCTVIYVGDLSDRFLSPDRHPEFRRVRIKLVEQWPANMDLWERYAEIRRGEMRVGERFHPAATEFYTEHREAMDAGAVISWPDRKKKRDLSGLQTAMNWFFDNPRGFKAEAQNDPEPVGAGVGVKQLNAEAVAASLSGLPRFEVPREAAHLTAFIDVGGSVHWYAVAAWDSQFGGSLIDYGAWPRQNRSHFAASDPRPSLADHYNRDRPKPLAESELVYAGLTDLVNALAGRVYYRDGGGEIALERLLIDCGWQTATVFRFCRETPHRALVWPSKGIGRTATARGVSEWKPRPGEPRPGFFWRRTQAETGRGQMIQFDPDAWKSFVFERLTTAPGGRGRLTLYGRQAADHDMIGQHCAAEAAEPVTLRGSTFDKWSVLPHRPDNHLWDCVVGSALAASVCGLQWSPTPDAPATRAEPRPAGGKRFSDIQRERRGA